MSDSKNRDEVQLIVFKENLASRHFRIPLTWFTRLGILFGSLAIVSVVSLILAIKNYVKLRHDAPVRLELLEKELADLKLAYHQLETKSLEPKTIVLPENIPLPQPVSAPAPTPAPSPVEALPDPANLPFHLESTSAAWKGNLLQVKFNIQYVKEDGKNQQGKIIIIAKGPGHTFTYPKGAANGPQNGEHFSVSRFRATKATLGPIAPHSMIQEIEILIYNSDLKLLLRKNLKSETFSTLPIAVPSPEPSPLSSPSP